MRKDLRGMITGAAMTFAAMFAVSAVATIYGTPPEPGFRMIDGTWVANLAAGHNNTYVASLTARAGGTQAACTALADGVYLQEIDTAATANDSVCLPFANPPNVIVVTNQGAAAVAVFANASTNPATGTTDSINGVANTAQLTLSPQSGAMFFSAKAGRWSTVPKL